LQALFITARALPVATTTTVVSTMNTAFIGDLVILVPQRRKSKRAADEPTLNERRPGREGRSALFFTVSGTLIRAAYLPQQSSPEGALSWVLAGIAVRQLRLLNRSLRYHWGE
jgi:hypothetical protein